MGLIIASLSLAGLVACTERTKGVLSGDIVFQTLHSSQSKAIRAATGSRWTHCGIVFADKNDDLYVLEAVQPVRAVPYQDWIKKGSGGEFVIKRLVDRDAILTPMISANMTQTGQLLLGKNYDLYFNWSDERIYCSELVWKIYDRGAGIQLCDLRELRTFDLKDSIVKTKLQERYGNAIPMNEPVVAPSDLFESKMLETVE